MRLATQSGILGSPLDFSASEDYTSTGFASSGYTGIAPGTIIQAAPTLDATVVTPGGVADWIGSTLMYVKWVGGLTILPGRLMHVNRAAGLTDMPNTANTGRPVVVTLTSFSAGDVTPQGGWVMISGIAPVQYSGTVAIGPVYFAAAGQATSVATAGKQIVNATCLVSTTTFTRAVDIKNNSFDIRTNSQQGLYIGQSVSGTGIGASAVIAALGADGFTVTLSVASTATGQVTATFTPTGYGICHINNAFVQGQIT